MTKWDISDVKVIIPIGGEATRLRPLTIETSKAAVRLLNRPLIEYTILELAKQGIKEFIFQWCFTKLFHLKDIILVLSKRD